MQNVVGREQDKINAGQIQLPWLPGQGGEIMQHGLCGSLRTAQNTNVYYQKKPSHISHM